MKSAVGSTGLHPRTTAYCNSDGRFAQIASWQYCSMAWPTLLDCRLRELRRNHCATAGQAQTRTYALRYRAPSRSSARFVIPTRKSSPSPAERVLLAFGELRQTNIDLGLAGNARIVANAAGSIRYARADRHPGTHQLRKQHGPLADHNQIREHQGAPRQISLSKLFANSIATFAFISARSAHIRRYFWN